ncbi:MAG: DUF2628 domain-containing protein [Pseudomonadota bacterium]
MSIIEEYDMKVYNVLSSTETKDKSTVFIEEGFSFFAFIFQVAWLLYHRTWLPAIMIFIVNSILYTLSQKNYLSVELFGGLNLILALIVGFFAKTWYLESLKRKDYVQESLIAARNLDEAKFKYYKQIGEEYVR